MKVIFSTQAVVEFDGKHYYSNAVQSTYKRYTIFGGEIRCLSHIKEVDVGTQDLIDENAVQFVGMKKINTLKKYIVDRKYNDKLIEKEVAVADVCIAHVPCYHSESVVKYAKEYNKPYLTVVVGCPWDALWNYNYKGKLLAFGSYWTLKKIQKKSQYSIYVTNEFLQHRYPTTGHWIGCSNVNISTGIDGVLERRLSQINNRELSNQILKIGTTAALDVPYKGQIYVIRALAKLKKQGQIFEYHLVGAGHGDKLKAEVRKLGLDDQVYFHGCVEHSRITQFLDELDIYIQPSKQEGLPRATIEAMSRGCLCIGSHIAGIPELLLKEYLFPKGNVKAIVRILSNISFEDCRKQAVRNYNFAKQYDVDRLNAKRADFLQQFMDRCVLSKHLPKALLIPSNTDLNRGDQALVWESIRIVEDVYGKDKIECVLMGDISSRDAYLQNRQTRNLGYRMIDTILKHPGRKFAVRRGDSISYSKTTMVQWGLQAIVDYIRTRMLLSPNPFIRNFGKLFLSDKQKLIVNEFQEAESVFVKGGGFLHSYGPITDSYLMYFSTYHIRLALALGKKVIILPNSIGPLKNSVAKHIVLKCLRECALVTVRENISKKCLEDFGIDSKCFPDLGFYLKSTEHEMSSYLQKNGVPTDAKKVVITLRPYRFSGSSNHDELYKNYVSGVKNLVDYLVESGYHITFIAHTLGPSSHENDSIAIKEVMNLLSSETLSSVTFIEDFNLNCRDIEKIYSYYDYMVGTRFHSVIFSLNMYVPSIAISYGGNKGKGVMKDLGNSDFSIDMDKIQENTIVEMFKKLTNQKMEYIENLKVKRTCFDKERLAFVNTIRETLNIRE